MKTFNVITILVFLTTAAFGQITWQKQTGPYGGYISDMAYHSSGKIYAIVSYSLYVSTDNAVSWTLLDPGLGSNQINDVEIDGAGTIYVISTSNLAVSTDNGVTFVKKNTTSTFSSGIKVKKNPGTGTLYVLGYDNGVSKSRIFRSTDGGVTWSNSGYAFTNNPFDIAVTAGGYVFSNEGSASNFIERSSDDGVTFSSITSGISETAMSSLAVNVAGTKVYCVTTSKVYESDPATISWTSITGALTGQISDFVYSNRDVSFLAFSPDGTKRYFVDNYNRKFYTQTISPSVGAWTATVASNFVSNSGVTGIQVLSMAIKDNNTMFFGTDEQGVIKTSNGGGVVSEANPGIEGYGYSDFVIADNGNVVVATRGQISTSNLFTSTDGGQTYTRKTLLSSGPFYINRLFKVSGTTIVAFGQDYLSGAAIAYRSTDSGQTWSTTGVTAPVSSCYKYESPDGTKIIANNGTNYYYSSNAGAVWAASPIAITGFPTPAGTYNLSGYSLDASMRMVTFGDNAGTRELYRVSFNGTFTTGTATKISTLPNVTNFDNISGNPVTYQNNTYLLARDNSGNWFMEVSTDGGATWTSHAVTNGGYQLFVDAINGYIFMANSQNTSQRISISRDGGVTFPTVTTISPTSSKGSIAGVKVDASGTAYVFSDYVSLYKSTATIITPAAPTLLAEVGHFTDRVFLRFQDNSSIETSFEVDRSTDNISFDSIGKVNQGFNANQLMYFEDKGLQPGTTYYYKVASENSAGSSFTSSISVATLPAGTTSIPDNRSWTGATTNANGLGGPFAITNAAIRSVGTNQFSISDVTGGAMNPISGDATIAEQFFESGGITYFEPNSTGNKLVPNGNGTYNSTTKVLTLLWRVNAAYSTGYPNRFEQINLTLNTNDPTPAAPTNVAAYVYNTNSIEVRWSSANFDKTYTVERSTSPTFASAITVLSPTVGYPTTTFLDNSTFTQGTTYYYRVKVQNQNAVPGVSPYSAITSVVYAKPNFTLTTSPVSATVGSVSGVIWGDFNNDGFDDLIMQQLTGFFGTTSTPFVFKNTNGVFSTVSNSGLDVASYLAATVGDYNNDGKLDIFFSVIGTQQLLYKGNGDLTFTKVDPTAVQEADVSNLNSIYLATTWGDFNKDGILDLVVGMDDNNYSTLMYAGNADGSFTKITSGPEVQNTGFTAAVSWVDVDNDGDLDLFFADQDNAGVNRLYLNNGSGTFTASTTFAADVGLRGFSASWGDYNNDEFLDLFLGTQGTTNILYKNNGNGTFTKQTSNLLMTDVKLANVSTFGSAWGDFNNDGYLDLIVSNSGLNQFYINNANPPNNTFTKVTSEKIASSLLTFGLALSDYDHDGFLDVAMAGLDFNSIKNSLQSNVNSYLFKNINTLTATSNYYDIQLKGTTSNKSGIGTRIRLTAGGKTQVREISTSTGFLSQGSLMAHFGLGANTAITSLQIKWPSGIIQTMNNITSLNQIRVITEDGAAPVVTLLNPLNSAVNVPVATLVEITFDEAPLPVTGKKINLTVHGSGSPAFSLDASSGVISGNKISFTPTAALGFLTQYDVAVDAGAFTDQYGNATPVITWSFVSLDNVAPVITFTPPTPVNKGAVPSASFVATSTDNGGIISSMALSWRKIGGGTFTDLPGVFDATSGKWGFAVTESMPDGNGLEYYITAKDPAGNVGRFPLDPAVNLYVYLSYPTTQSVIPTASLGLGGQVANWKIFTVPFDLGSNSGISAVMDEIATDLNDKTKIRLLTYKNDAAWGEFPGDFSSFTRGQGYFINIRNAPTTNITAGDVIAASNNRLNLFPMNLKKGWNEVGNPYLTPISWGDVAAFNSLSGTAASLKTFVNPNYATATTLQPFEGGFVFVDNDVTVSIPFAGQTAIGGRVAQIDNVTSDLGQNQWQVGLTLSQNGMVNTLSGIGMRPNASLSMDQFDDINPPQFFEYLEVNFVHQEYFAKNFSVDVVPTQSYYVWEFNIASNQVGGAELVWDNSLFGSGNNEMYLLDMATQTPINMRQFAKYAFNPNESRKFRIYFGTNLEQKIMPDGVLLGEAYPNPTPGMTTIPFTVSEKNAAPVRVEVYDMMGRLVTVLVDQNLGSGFYTTNWNTSGMNVAEGLYVYRLVVGGRATTQSKKLSVIK